MKIQLTERLRKSYAGAPPGVRRAFDKQVRLLACDLRHPSLRAKKYDEAHDIWQARATRSWRFYFTIEADTCTIIGLVPHQK